MNVFWVVLMLLLLRQLLFVFRAPHFFLYGVLMSPVFLFTYPPSHTLDTVGPLRYEMLIFPIHLTFIFISPRWTVCECACVFHIHLNGKLKENIKWKDQHYNDSSAHREWKFLCSQFLLLLFFCSALVACSKRKRKKKHYSSTSLRFVLLYSFLLVSILYPY